MKNKERRRSETEKERIFMLSEYSKQRLLTYADSLKELARVIKQGEPDPQLVAALGQEASEPIHADWNQDRALHLYQCKLSENRTILADNLSDVADIMAEAVKEAYGWEPLRERVMKRIVHAMKAEGINIKDVCYINNVDNRTHINVTMCTEKKGGYDVEEVADMLSVLMEKKLAPSVVSPYIVDQEYKTFRFLEEPSYIAMTGSARVVKESEKISGDNYSIVETENGKTIMILSDGAGSGERACESSETVLDLLETLLDAGYQIEKAIDVVNHTIHIKGDEECIATMDLCQLDLYQGICELRKVGAAASFLKRAGMVEQIVSKTLPLGVCKTVESDCTRRRLQDGDYIIMVSDGVIGAFESTEEGKDLCESICRIQLENPKEIADAILREAIKVGKGYVRDDMTVMVAGVWNNV